MLTKIHEEFLQEEYKTSPSLIGSKICLKNTHCKLDKQSLEEYLDLKCLEIYKTKHKQYFIKNSKKNSKNIEVTYECRKKIYFRSLVTNYVPNISFFIIKYY